MHHFSRNGSAWIVALIVFVGILAAGTLLFFWTKLTPRVGANPSAATSGANSAIVIVHPYVVTHPELPPDIGANPDSGNVGSEITLVVHNGTVFLASGASIYFDGDLVSAPGSVVNWEGPNTGLVFTIPPDAAMGPHTIFVTDSRGTSTIATYTVDSVAPSPIIDSLDPSSGPIGTVVTVHGENLALAPGGREVLVEFGSTQLDASASTDGKSVTFTVPTTTPYPIFPPGIYNIWVDTPYNSNVLHFTVTN